MLPVHNVTDGWKINIVNLPDAHNPLLFTVGYFESFCTTTKLFEEIFQNSNDSSEVIMINQPEIHPKLIK